MCTLLEQCAKLIFTVLYNYLDPSAVFLDSLVRPSLLSLPKLRAESGGVLKISGIRENQNTLGQAVPMMSSAFLVSCVTVLEKILPLNR